jgi:ABC-type nitrate/sulfonate/bicarbonate transport system permease component
MPAGRGAARNILPPAIALTLILVAWEAYSRFALGALPGSTRLLPAPTAIVGALFDNAGAIAPHAWQTILETVIGFALALVLGVGLSIVIDSSAVLRRAIYPLLVVTQTIPLLALAPLLVLWFGFELTPKLLIVVLVCFFPIVVAGADGLRATDPELVRLFRTFGADRWTIFRRVRFPGALPALFSGIKIAATYCVVGAIWGEYVGARWGLGIFMQQRQHAGDVETVFAVILLVSALSVAIFMLVSLLERIIIPWHYIGRGTDTEQPALLQARNQ